MARGTDLTDTQRRPLRGSPARAPHAPRPGLAPHGTFGGVAETHSRRTARARPTIRPDLYRSPISTAYAASVNAPSRHPDARRPAATSSRSGGLARVMALPGVQALMPGQLRTAPRSDDELRALDHDQGTE